MSETTEVIHSIDRALDVLLLLQQEGKEMGVTQISTKLGMYKSTVHRTLATLENKGFVEQNPDNGKYWLGLKLYAMGMLVRDKLSIVNIVYPYAKALSDRFNEVVHISVLDKNNRGYPHHIVLEKIESNKVLSFTPPRGSSSPCHCSAVGKVLLAYSPREFLKPYIGTELPRYTAKTITDWDCLLKELVAIKRQGYALDDGELEQGLICVAAPIFGLNKEEAVAALSLSGPAARIKSEQFNEIVEEVQKMTAAISERLQC